MANYDILKGAVQQSIKQNGENEITGDLLQQTLLAIVSSLGAQFQFAGIATPSTNPGTPDQNVAYIAGPGTYPNFDNTTIPSQYMGVFCYNGSWSHSIFQTSSIAIQSVSDGIVQLMDGDTPIYPRTKGNAVFLDNDVTKTVAQAIETLNSKFNFGIDVANFTTYTRWGTGGSTPSGVTINGREVTIVAPISNVNTELYFATQANKTYHLECVVSSVGNNTTLRVWNNPDYPNLPTNQPGYTANHLADGVLSGNKFTCDFTAKGPQSAVRIGTDANSTVTYTFSITQAGDGKLKESALPSTVVQELQTLSLLPSVVAGNSQAISELQGSIADLEDIKDLFVLDTSKPIASLDSYGQFTAYADCALTIQNNGFTWTQGQAANYGIYFKFPTVVGETYELSIKVLQGSFDATPAVYNNQNYPNAPTVSWQNKLVVLVAGEGGVYTARFTATGVESYVRMQIPYSVAVLRAENFVYVADSESDAYLKPSALPAIPTEKINHIEPISPALYVVQGTPNFWLYNYGLCKSNLNDNEYTLSPMSSDIISAASNDTCPSKILAKTNGGVNIDRELVLTPWSKLGKINTGVKFSFKCRPMPSNPGTMKNILFVGDSLIARGKMTSFFLDSLSTLGFTNLRLIGRTYHTEATNRFEAVGGYAWQNYVCNPATLPAAYGNNYFWNPTTQKIDAQYYVNTYCNGDTPSFVICNIGWNQVVNSAFSVDYDIETIEGYVKEFLDEIHRAFPSCRVILNGMHRGNPDYQSPSVGWNERLQQLNDLYYSIAVSPTYNGFVLYCDIAPYFDGRTGMPMDTRVKNQWTTETENYISDFVHPNDIGFHMHANAVLQCFLYDLYRTQN